MEKVVIVSLKSVSMGLLCLLWLMAGIVRLPEMGYAVLLVGATPLFIALKWLGKEGIELHALALFIQTWSFLLLGFGGLLVSSLSR